MTETPATPQDTPDPNDIRDLLDASSLGTPAAKALRARTTPDQASAVRERVRRKTETDVPDVPDGLKPMSDQDTALTIAHMNPAVSVTQAELVMLLLRRNGWLLPAGVAAHEQQIREQIATEIEETIDADRSGGYESGLRRAVRIARGEVR